MGRGPPDVTADEKGDIQLAVRRKVFMATYTPPPYFPQSSLSPPDKNRYRKFKLALVGVILLLVLLVGGVVTGIVYALKWLL
jgi:hypothetical protein